MSRSKYDILNVGYGVLNPQYSSLSGKNYNSGESQTSGFFNQFHRAINISNQTRKSNFNGPMVGICLRNEGRVSKSGWIDPSCWAAVSSEIIETGSELDLVQIRVRVPEIHAEKSVPKDLPDRLIKDSNHDIINQYPVFVSQFSSVTEPVAGDLVWIDFQDRGNQMGGIFLGLAQSNSFNAKSEKKESKEETKKPFKRRKRKIVRVADGRVSKNTKSRVFVTGDSNTVRMTAARPGSHEFGSFYTEAESRGEIYENARSGIGWKRASEKIQELETAASGFKSGDILIIGSIGGNWSKNSLFMEYYKTYPGKFSSGSGYSKKYFEDSGVKNLQNQKPENTKLLNKSIKEESKGYKSFINNNNWKKFSEKLVEVSNKGVTVIVFGPPIGGNPERYLNRTFIDQLQQHWFKNNAKSIKYISVLEKSKILKADPKDVNDGVHYSENDPSYTKYFNLLIAPHLE
jgi:hypothetical protein